MPYLVINIYLSIVFFFCWYPPITLRSLYFFVWLSSVLHSLDSSLTSKWLGWKSQFFGSSSAQRLSSLQYDNCITIAQYYPWPTLSVSDQPAWHWAIFSRSFSSQLYGEKEKNCYCNMDIHHWQSIYTKFEFDWACFGEDIWSRWVWCGSGPRLVTESNLLSTLTRTLCLSVPDHVSIMSGACLATVIDGFFGSD